MSENKPKSMKMNCELVNEIREDCGLINFINREGKRFTKFELKIIKNLQKNINKLLKKEKK